VTILTNIGVHLACSEKLLNQKASATASMVMKTTKLMMNVVINGDKRESYFDMLDVASDKEDGSSE
jgi:hypothetical protein